MSLAEFLHNGKFSRRRSARSKHHQSPVVHQDDGFRSALLERGAPASVAPEYMRVRYEKWVNG